MIVHAPQFDHISRVPKDLVENIRYRRHILTAAAHDPELQKEIWNVCARDELYFFNAMMFTYDPRKKTRTIPFVTYGYQDEVIAHMRQSYGVEDMLVIKSRDMGASWLAMGYVLHKWLFEPHHSILLGSRKEDLVDKRGDTSSLFGKIDFAMTLLPRWMIPEHSRNNLRLVNDLNGSVVVGESTNSNFARAGRYGMIYLDEYAAVDVAYEIEAATRDATRCRWYNSTPQGMGNAFYKKHEKMKEIAPHQVRGLHWSEHPEKRAGLYTSKGGVPSIIDDDYEFAEDFRFITDEKLRSPWYDDQCKRAASEQEIAQELDMDFAKSGWQWFSSDKLKPLLAQACNPCVRGELHWTGIEKPVFVPEENGRLKLWVELDVEGDFNRSETYILGSDVALGTGGKYATNSVTSVMGAFTGIKIAEMATNRMEPAEFADYTMAMGRWFHGKDATAVGFLIWEMNGPGAAFGSRVVKSRYPRVFYRRANEHSTVKKTTTVPGWYTGDKNKALLLNSYKIALLEGKFKNLCKEALMECAEYIHQPNGDIVHGHSLALKGVDPTVSGVNHGDRVIADALCWRGKEERTVALPKPQAKEPPPGSYLARRLSRQKAAIKEW